MEGEYSSDEDTPDVISFDEIVAGETMRVVVIDGEQYLSVKDVVKLGGGSTVPRQAIDEISFLVKTWKFSGSDDSEEEVILFQGAIKLLTWLPIGHARWSCRKMVDTLIKNYRGDRGMLRDVYAIAMSKTNQDDETTRKRKALDLEDLKMGLNAKRLDLQTRAWKAYANVCADNEIDTAGREHFKKVLVVISSVVAGIYP
jgi:hypothetical protein